MINRLILIGLSFVVFACSNTRTSLEIVNHEKPDLTVDFSPFEKVGCKWDAYGTYYCGEQSTLLKLGCKSISKDKLLGGLTPAYPIAPCGYLFDEGKIGSVDFDVECFSYNIMIDGMACKRFVIFKDGKYILVRNINEFANLFAPVETAEEALGFALVTGFYHAMYGQEINDNYIYYVLKLEDTNVKVVGNGYLVNLFYSPEIGCGPFNTEMINIKVSRNGQVEMANRFPVYRDPLQDTVCAD